MGRAARMSVTTAQGEGGLENREGEQRDETWTSIVSYNISALCYHYEAINSDPGPCPAHACAAMNQDW